MNVRGLSPKDLDQVKRIHLLAFREIHETSESILTFIKNQEKYGNCVVENDGELQGYSFFSKQGSGLYWNWFAVLPDAEGTGAAEALLAETEVWAKREGLKSITLDSRNRFKRHSYFISKTVSKSSEHFYISMAR